MEASANLVSGVWTNAGYTITGTHVMGGGISYNEVTNSIPTVHDKNFIRLRISVP